MAPCARQKFFSFGGEFPPGARLSAVHEVDGGHEGVGHAGIVSGAGEFVEFVVEFEAVFPFELRGALDAEQAQVFGDGFADVGDVFEFSGLCCNFCFHKKILALKF